MSEEVTEVGQMILLLGKLIAVSERQLAASEQSAALLGKLVAFAERRAAAPAQAPAARPAAPPAQRAAAAPAPADPAPQARVGGVGSPVPPIAPDSDLDGQYGNTSVTKDPPRWMGPAVAPCKLSDASVDWLMAYADFRTWVAEKNDEAGDSKKAWYARMDAARARGWAQRARAAGRLVTMAAGEYVDDGTQPYADSQVQPENLAF